MATTTKKRPGDADRRPFLEEGELDVLTEERVRAKRPNMYCVIMLNDDYTPMDFVVWVIQHIFHKSLQEASHLMLNVHNKGRARMGIFTRDMAQTKVTQVHALAEQNQHPLQCILEVEAGDG